MTSAVCGKQTRGSSQQRGSSQPRGEEGRIAHEEVTVTPIIDRCEYHRGHPCRLIGNAVTRRGGGVRRIAPPPPRFRRCFSLCGEGPERQDDQEEEGEASPICCICVPSAGGAALWGSALLLPT
ncbi:unnamed protein product [Boreogadus saida]